MASTNKGFFFSGYSDWHIDTIKAINSANFLEELLSSNLSIQKYGQGLAEIAFFHIIMASTKGYSSDKSFSRKKKILYISLELDFPRAVKANLEELIELEAILFLESIKRYKAWKIKDFDSDLFYQDVKNLFVGKGVIKPENLEKASEWVKITI